MSNLLKLNHDAQIFYHCGQQVSVVEPDAVRRHVNSVDFGLKRSERCSLKDNCGVHNQNGDGVFIKVKLKRVEPFQEVGMTLW